ncbi:MAG: hypothetical protein ACT6R2_04415 [Blastomonas fulva]
MFIKFDGFAYRIDSEMSRLAIDEAEIYDVIFVARLLAKRICWTQAVT